MTEDIKGPAFKESGNWYKGNLHSHTSVSDGSLTPQESAELYIANGYSFLCQSDHNIYTDHRADLNRDGFIIIPGLEYEAALYKSDKPGKRKIKVHHMQGILGTTEMQRNAPKEIWRHMEPVERLRYYGKWDGQKAADKMTKMFRDRGMFAIYNHPIWSRVEDIDFTSTEGLAAIEIFNYGTDLESQTGLDTVWWDTMLRRGIKINAVATDDNHNSPFLHDSCGGYIMVKAPELTHDAIVSAIIAGSYYSTGGPEIKDWGVKGGSAYIECSPANKITFVAGNYINDGASLSDPAERNGLTSGKYLLRGHETYIRAEVRDSQGKTAWTNPIYLK